MRTRCLRFFEICTLVLAASSAHAEKHIEERHACDPRGSVEINNVSGSVQLQGWDKPEVEVTGTAGGDVEQVSVSGDPFHLVVQVISRQNRLWGSESSAQLTVRVPATSSVTATVVSADVTVAGVTGDLKLQSVSGDVKGDVGGDVRAGSVSGDITLSAPSAKSVALKTVSGDIRFRGGSGETEVSTVSGNIEVKEGIQSRASFRSVSGDISAALGVSEDAQIDGESVSGTVKLKFATLPAANFDVQTFSGDIDNCFGPKPVQPARGSGSRLEFKNGDGTARVQISTKSGDVSLCTAHGQPSKQSE